MILGDLSVSWPLPPKSCGRDGSVGAQGLCGVQLWPAAGGRRAPGRRPWWAVETGRWPPRGLRLSESFLQKPPNALPVPGVSAACLPSLPPSRSSESPRALQPSPGTLQPCPVPPTTPALVRLPIPQAAWVTGQATEELSLSGLTCPLRIPPDATAPPLRESQQIPAPLNLSLLTSEMGAEWPSSSGCWRDRSDCYSSVTQAARGRVTPHPRPFPLLP